MTTKHKSGQVERSTRSRAVWLARLSAGRSLRDATHQERRAQANDLARAQGADVVGEFLISSGEDEHLADHVWSEVVDFIRDTGSTLLIILRPDEVAVALRDYARRVEDLEEANIRLVLPDPSVVLQPSRQSGEAGETA